MPREPSRKAPSVPPVASADAKEQEPPVPALELKLEAIQQLLTVSYEVLILVRRVQVVDAVEGNRETFVLVNERAAELAKQVEKLAGGVKGE
jgi:hypothetical protein